MKNKIVIIGAGLVGCLWALLLRKRNFEVEVYEKRPDMRRKSLDSGRSINLIITSRGMKALQLAGLDQKAQQISMPVYGRMMHSKTGELNYQAYGQENERNLSISRSQLNQFLLDEAEKAGARIYFEHAVEDIDFKQHLATFTKVQGAEKSSPRVSYDLLFGTDGAGSLVRKKMAEKFPDMVKEKTEWLGADYKELFLPQPNNLDKKSLHIWPRGSHMMMALANLDGSFTVTLYLPADKTSGHAVSFDRIRRKEDIQDLFESEFADSIPLMPHYIQDFQSHPQGALGTVRCSKWTYQDSVCLLGDAAHAIVPFFGQGMNSGFEDCTELLKILDSQDGNWYRSLELFDQTRKPDANAIADMAIENWIEMSEKVADPKFLLRKKVESLLEKKFPEIFKSRYGMVTYSLIPYSLVKKAGEVQNQIFDELCADISSPDQLSLDSAENLLHSLYLPFLTQHNISLTRFHY